jgi:trehalose utilization protein
MGPRITVWNEFHHEKHNAKSAEVYPDGITIRDTRGPCRAWPDRCPHGDSR